MDIQNNEPHYSENVPLSSHTNDMKKKKYWWMLVSGCAVCVIVLIVIASEGFAFITAIKEAKQAKELVEQSLESATKLEFSDASATAQTGREIMERAKLRVENIRILRIVPWVGTQVRSADGLLTASVYASEGIERTFVWAQDIPFQTKGETVVSIDPEKSKKVFSRLIEFPSLVIMVDNLFVQALDTLQTIPEDGVAAEISDSKDALISQISAVEKTLSQYVPLAQTLPHVSGATEDKTYLWILMNNDELRPTGGYISAYAYTRFSGGALTEFVVDNSRNLDKGITSTSKKAPAQIQKYDTEHGLGSSWLFHDSSWSPDYPTAVEDMIALFTEQMQKQGQRPQKIDGVVAITPSFVGKFLLLTGPVDVQGYRVDNTNVADVLEIDAHRGFRERGLSEEQRKQLIFDLGTVLLRTLGKGGVEEWQKIVKTFEQGMNEKHMMVFHTDEIVQQKVQEKGWDGKMAQSKGDYLMVVDSNLGSFKSDIGIDRSIDYSVDLREKNPRMSITITYQNKNTLLWKTRPIYRTYMRAYAPKGSLLLETKGISKKEVVVDEEVQKTSFGALVEVPIGRKKSITFVYTVPPSFLAEPYTLTLQKQPGTLAIPFKVSIQTPRPIQTKISVPDVLLDNNTRYESKIRLVTDHTYQLAF